MGKFFVVGLGPGDPELITVKAVKALEASEIVFVPQSKRKEQSLAWEICQHWVDKARLKIIHFAMKPQGPDQEGYQALAQEINHLLTQGKTVSYITIGDPAIYSTAIYLCQELKKYQVKINYIPGISAFNAGAALLGLALCEKGQDLGLYEMPDEPHLASERIQRHTTTVFMKVNQRVSILLEAIRATSPKEAFLLQRIGLPGEKVYDLLSLSEPLEKAYLSLAIIRR